MIKGIQLTLLFFASLYLTLIFQSCGSSSMDTNGSNAGGLPLEINPPSGSGSSTTNCEVDQNTFEMDCGHNVQFFNTDKQNLQLRTTRILRKSVYTMMETSLYEFDDGSNFSIELPTSYCENSALPHCAHKTGYCPGYGCFLSSTPIICHQQRRLSGAFEENTFQALSELNYQVKAEGLEMTNCQNPFLAFQKESDSLKVFLSPEGCVPSGENYTINNSGDDILSLFLNEQTRVNESKASGYCNLYSNFQKTNTRFTYSSVDQEQAKETHVQYEEGIAQLRWKVSNDDRFFCATLPINEIRLDDTFFPADGLSYEILSIQTTGTNQMASITYEDPSDGGFVWTFYLDQQSAGAAGGGAVLDSETAAAMKTFMDETLVEQATSNANGSPTPCG